MTNDKDSKGAEKSGKKILKKQSGGMTFVVNRRNNSIAPSQGNDKTYETKSTGPKSHLVKKDE